ncbi:hypothetical protein ACSSS7_000460 [Eimeria intestinalis]
MALESSVSGGLEGKTRIIAEMVFRVVGNGGCLVPHGEAKSSGDSRPQHAGFGRRLIQAAEIVALSQGYHRMAVIAGIGTREYYRASGYHLEDSYMVKELTVVGLHAGRTDLVSDMPSKLLIEHYDLEKAAFTLFLPLPPKAPHQQRRKELQKNNRKRGKAKSTLADAAEAAEVEGSATTRESMQEAQLFAVESISKREEINVSSLLETIEHKQQEGKDEKKSDSKDSGRGIFSDVDTYEEWRCRYTSEMSSNGKRREDDSSSSFKDTSTVSMKTEHNGFNSNLNIPTNHQRNCLGSTCETHIHKMRFCTLHVTSDINLNEEKIGVSCAAIDAAAQAAIAATIPPAAQAAAPAARSCTSSSSTTCCTQLHQLKQQHLLHAAAAAQAAAPAARSCSSSSSSTCCTQLHQLKQQHLLHAAAPAQAAQAAPAARSCTSSSSSSSSTRCTQLQQLKHRLLLQQLEQHLLQQQQLHQQIEKDHIFTQEVFYPP